MTTYELVVTPHVSYLATPEYRASHAPQTLTFSTRDDLRAELEAQGVPMALAGTASGRYVLSGWRWEWRVVAEVTRQERPEQGVSSYQRTHRPVRILEVLCASRKPLKNGHCPDCARHLLRGGRPHKPNQHGIFGVVEFYADGSTRTVVGERMPWCLVCEQSDVPAVHRTPLLGHACVAGRYITGDHPR